MTNLLLPYGKDAQHLQVVKQVGMARTLLRITPEDYFDCQPIYDEASGLVIAFDGRLDNREELGCKLGLDSARLNTLSDGTLALECWKVWQSGALQYFLGDFAVACWHRSENAIYLARDPMGIRPLFWCQKGDLIGFATMPKALFAIPGISQDLSEERLHDTLCLLPARGRNTLYRDLFRVEPGNVIKIGHSGISNSAFHTFSPRHRIRLSDDQEYLEAFGAELERSIRCRIRSATPVSSELSSGLDSSTVTATAARLLDKSGSRLSAYTSVPVQGFNQKVLKGWYADEGPGAKAVAALYPNIDHYLVSSAQESPIDGLEELIEIRDSAPANLCNLVWMNRVLAEASSRGSRVLLGGLFGNMNISYDGAPYLPGLLRRGNLIKLYRQLSAFKSTRPGFSNRRLLEHCIGPFMPRWLWQRLMERRGRHHRLFDYCPIHPEFSQRMKTEQRARRLGWDLSYRPWSDGRKMRIAVLQRVDIGEFYAACNAAGIERRDVTADVRLTEFCLAIPESLFFHNGQPQWLLKRLMNERLPREVLEARGRGLQGADWHIGAEASLPKLRTQLARLKAHPRVGRYLDLESLERALDDWPEEGWDSYESMQRYRSKLLKGLSFGTFIKYNDPGN